MNSQLRNVILAAVVGVAAAATGCDRDNNGSAPAPAPQAGSGGQANPEKPKEGEHKRLPLGEKTVGSLKLVATMDEPVMKAGGGEGAFDVVITGGKPKAVRFWIGAENAEGSVKAKADEETPDNWHTHAEVPKPLPAGSKFWVEVEPPTGDAFKTSFDLLLK